MSSAKNEEIIFKYVLDNPTYYKYIDRSFFTNKDLGELITVAKEFYDSYKSVPTEAQMLANVNAKELDIGKELIHTVYGIQIVNYDTEWIKGTVESWIKWCAVKMNIVDACVYAKQSKVDANNVDYVVQHIIDIVNKTNEVNFNFSEGLDFFDAASHRQYSGEKIRTGYNYIDTVTNGGYDPKTLISYVGPSNIGKCVCPETVINIKNRHTGETRRITIGEFYKMVKENGQD